MPPTLLSIASPQAILLLALKLIAATVAAFPVALPGCPEACGNITVPYPFGIGQGCFRPGFNLTCDETHYPPRLLVEHNVQVLNISLPDGTMRIHSRALNTSSHHFNGSWSAGLMDAGPLKVSAIYNVFVSIGCNILARLTVANPEVHDPNTPRGFVSICAAVCLDGLPSPFENTSCSGDTCCQMSISQGAASYGVQVNSLDQADGIDTGFGAVFIVDREWFSKNLSSIMEDILSNLIVPTVLDWFLDSKRDNDMFFFDPVISGLRCISLNSTAAVVGQSNQLQCNCLDGFQGNPYIINGCQAAERRAVNHALVEQQQSRRPDSRPPRRRAAQLRTDGRRRRRAGPIRWLVER
ncbi:hypothetical protein EJB05_39951, partial [Eragrostis curvula]